MFFEKFVAGCGPAVASAVFGLVAVMTPVASAATPISIMPIGDSITAGTVPGGYRAPIANQLANNGFAPTLIGSQTDTSQIAAYQHHEGHGGFRLDQLSGNLNGYIPIDSGVNGGYWLTGGHGTGRSAVNPNYVTVLGGINDINGFYSGSSGTSNPATSSTNPMSTPTNTAFIEQTIQDRMTTLVNTVVSTLPSAAVMVCATIPYANGFLDSSVTGATDSQRTIWGAQDGVSAGQEYGVNHYVILFDKWLKNTFVPQQKAAGHNVYYVDTYSDFIQSDGGVAPLYGDYGLHPNQTGYNLMGATIASAIQAVATAPVPEPTTATVLGLIGLVAAGRRRRGGRSA